MESENNINEKDEEFPVVICSKCGYMMDIKEWMPAELLNCEIISTEGEVYKGLIPHMNRSHPCDNCGHLWDSTDNIIPIGSILVWDFCP